MTTHAGNESLQNTQSIVLGGGCFWCVEALFETVDGVKSATSGYAGGNTENPTYEEVCSGKTNHAEVVKIEFDPKKISLKEVIDFFWKAHNPTTLNRQGADTGTQYRSVIYYLNDEQKSVALASRDEEQSKIEDKIVTEIEPLKKFYKAEKYHQDYFKNNSNAAYCQYVIAPKLKKLKKTESNPQ